MADVNANIGIHIDSSAALAELKTLQRQLATFHGSIAKNSAASAAAQKGLQQNLLNSINATGQFHAQMGLVRTSTESFTHALENNKLSMREYFRYAGASTKSFGKLFKEEFNTIGKVAEERVRKMQTQYIKMGRDANGAMKAMSVTPATLNMNDYATKTAVAAQKQAIFNQLIKQGSTSLLNFGKNTQWAGRQLMVGFSVPLMYIGSIASKTFMEMEEQAIRFKRVYGDIFTSAEETEKAIKDIELLAKSFTKYGVAFTDTMKMAADAAAMGKTGAELTAQVAEATRLAVLGGVEQQQSLETTISLTNAFGISADQLASKINFLNAVENQTVVSIEDLTIAIPKAGPVIKQLGGDVEDLAFFLTAMKEGGINASEGANALKSGLASLINPSKKAAAMLMDLGVNINGIVEANAGDVKNTVIGFAQALDTLDPLNRSRAIEQLFGKFQFARLSTLFQNITKDGTQASKVLGLTQASVEELAIMSERELKRVEDAVGTNFKSAVEDLKVSIMPIGKAFLEALTPIVKFAAEILKKFDGLGDGTKKFIVVATTLVGILGPTLLMTFGLVANGAANIIKLFLALRSGFLKLSGNTTVLSQQTSYLNAEQLEAATVAASLNQAHTRLTQSFTLEASAVLALRNAYVQATTAALTFARANPGMMMPGFKGPTSKKFSTGSTYVPGVGNKDTVPSLLTPGEAVIPRDVAQNPAYQPIIDAMVNGSIQGFSKGSGGVQRITKLGKKPMSPSDDFTHVGRSESIETQKYLRETAGLSDYDRARIEFSEGIQKTMGKTPTVGSYGGLGFAFDKALNINLAKPGGISIEAFTSEWIKKGPGKWDADGRYLIESLHGGNNNVIDDAMLARVTEEAAKNNGRVTDDIIKRSFEDLPTNVKASSTYQSMDKKLRANAEYGITGISPNVNTVKAVLEDAVRKGHIAPAANPVDGSNVVIIDGDALEYNGKPTPLGKDGKPQKLSEVLGTKGFEYPTGVHSVVQRTDSKGNIVAGSINGYDPRFPNEVINLSSGSKRVRGNLGKRKDLKALPSQKTERTKKAKQEAKKRLKAKALEEMKKIDADVRSSSMAKVKPTDFGTLVTPTSGRSFPVDGIGGVYEKDGKKVFVKPMLDEKSARAELHANVIARNVHGLDTPRQVMRVMRDPNNKKRKIIVLESEFNPRLSESGIRKDFTKDQYFKQLVAANLRTDKDLKMGNLGGDILTDPGAAGVFGKASGRRDFVANLPSMEEMARINLSGVKGDVAARSPYWFGNATADIAKTMTAQEYQDRMIAEIDRVLPRLEIALRGMDLTPEERPFYQAMVDRLKAGRGVDWKKLHKLHTSIVVKPDELIEQEETGKTKKPKTTSKPGNVKSSSKNPKDTKLAPALKKGERVVQGQKADSRKVRKTRKTPRMRIVRPGFAYAGISQSETLANFGLKPNTSGMKIEMPPAGLSDAEFKKQFDALNNEAKKTTSRFKDLANKSNIAAGAISGLTMMAAFSGGKLGEIATTAMPFVFGLQGVIALLPLMKNPWIAAVAAIGSVAITMYALSDNAKKMGQKQAQYINSISATTNKMKRIGVVTEEFGASEIMDTRRAESLPTFSGKPITREGQQFGTNFMGSEVGKEISKGFSESLLTNRSTAVKQFALQLSSYVSDGVIDGVQAGDIARQISVDFQDMSLYPSIMGQLTSIIGPDGIDILKDPIEVRIKIINEEAANAALAADQIIPNLQSDESVSDILTESPITSTKRFFTDIKDQWFGSDRSNKAAAAGAAAANQLLSSAKAQADATQLQYEKDLDVLEAKKAIAKTEKDRVTAQTEIDTLTDKNKKDNIRIREETAKALAAQEEAFKKTNRRNQKLNFYNTNPAQTAFIEAGREQVRAKFKDGPQKDAAELMLSQSKNLNSKSLEVRINAIAQTGTNPTFLSGLMTMFAGEEDELKKQIDLAVKTRGIDESVAVVNQLAFLDDADLRKELFVGINAITDETEYGNVLKTISDLSGMDGKDFNVTAILKTQGLPGLIKLSKELAKVQKIKDPITKITQIQNIGLPAGAVTGISAEWEYFMSLPESVRKEAITAYVTSYEIIGKEEIDAEIEKRLAGKKGPSYASSKKYYESEAGRADVLGDLAFKPVEPRFKPGMDLPKTPDDLDDDNDDSTGKDRDTTLDDLFKKLRLVRDAAIKAKGDIKDLAKLTAGSGITKFTGLSQQLMAGSQGGYNRDFITMLGDMDDAMLASYVDVKKLKQGIVELLPTGKDLKELLNARDIGMYQNEQVAIVQNAIAQRAAFVKLKAAGVDSATALQMTANAADAVNINSSKVDSTKIEELSAVTKAAADDAFLLARGLEEASVAAAKDKKSATEKLETLKQAKEVFKYSAEDLKLIGDSPVLLNAVKRMLKPDQLTPVFNELKGKVEQILGDIKVTVAIDAKVNIGEIASQLQSIFDGIESNINALIANAEKVAKDKFAKAIAGANAKVDAAQAKIDDTIVVDENGDITSTTPGLNTLANQAAAAVAAEQKKIDDLNKTYDETVQGIENAYKLNTKDIVNKIDLINNKIKDLQNKGDIDANKLLDYGASAQGDFKGNNLTLAEAEKAISDVQLFIEKTYSRPAELAQQVIQGLQRDIEIIYTRSIETIQKEIEKIQRDISVNYEEPLKDMQDESSRLTENLAVMDKIAESINDKYKVQEDALAKVAELNQDIVEQQKQQLGLADALSKGDISAAAAAVQDMRATQAAKSLGAQQGTLGKAKQAELDAVISPVSGLTRDQIAERQYAIERASYELQQRRAKLEEDIEKKQEAIYQLENDPARLDKLEQIRKKEDEIYKLENLKLTAMNAVYAVQAQISARNASIATEQAALAKAETDLSVQQGIREKALKDAAESHETAMAGLKTALAAAETKAAEATKNLEAAQAALAKAQAEADAIVKAAEKAAAEASAAMKKDLEAVTAELEAARLKAIDFITQLGFAKAAAKELMEAFLGAQAAKDKFTAEEIARLAKEKKDNEDKEKAEADKKTKDAADKKQQDEENAYALALKAKEDAKNEMIRLESEQTVLSDKISLYQTTINTLNEKIKNGTELTYSEFYGLDQLMKELPSLLTKSDQLAKDVANAKKLYDSLPTPVKPVAPAVVPPVLTLSPEELKARIAKWRKANPWASSIPDSAIPNMTGFSSGGMVPKLFAEGGFSKGTDTVPAMLTPGEFVVRKAAVDKYGMNMLSALNEGYLHKGGPVGHKHRSGASSTPSGGYTTEDTSIKQKVWDKFLFPLVLSLDRFVAAQGDGVPFASTNQKQYAAWDKKATEQGLGSIGKEVLGQTALDATIMFSPSSSLVRSGVGAYATSKGVVGLEHLLPKGSFNFLGAAGSKLAAAAGSKLATNSAITPIVDLVKPKIETFNILKNATHASWSDNLAGQTLDPLNWISGKADSMGRLNYLGTKETFESAGENVYKLSLSSLLKASSGKGLIKASDFQKLFGAYPGGVKPDSDIWKAFLDSKYTGVLGDIVPEVGLKIPVKYAPVKLAPKVIPEDMGRIDISEFLDSYTAASKVIPDVPAALAAKPKLPDGYSLHVDKTNEYLHSIQVMKDGEVVGQLTWDKITNVVEGLNVSLRHQGQGIATEMWNYAKTISPITHSPYRTPAGDAFARSIGDPVPPLNDGWLPGDWTTSQLEAAMAKDGVVTTPAVISVAKAAPEVPPVAPDELPATLPKPSNNDDLEALIAYGRSWNNRRAAELRVTEKANPDYAKLYDLQKAVNEETLALRLRGIHERGPLGTALYGYEPTPERTLYQKHSANDSPYWKYSEDRGYYEHELATLEKAEKFGVPPADILALRKYLESPLLGHLPNQKAAIDSLVEKFIIPEGTTTYRGLSDVDLAALSGLQIGESFVSPSVRSITNDKDAAATIAAFGGTSGGNTDTVAKITFGEGVKGIPDIAAFAESQGLSHEGIIAANTKFIVEDFIPAATTASRYENQVGIHQINTVEGRGEIITKPVNEYVLRAVNNDEVSIPAVSPLTPIPPIASFSPDLPKIIKSKISASKLKKLTKLIDEDYAPSKSDAHRLMMANGGVVPGLGNKDTISSMLTPGEFVIKKSAVESYGAGNLAKINNGISTDSSVYNYSLSVNVNGNNLNPDDIASTVMQKIKYIDGQRIRGQR